MHHLLNWSYFSQNHLTHLPKAVTTVLFCIETPQSFPWTFLVVQSLQHPINLLSMTATSYLHYPLSCHILRPIIYKI